MIDRPDHIPYLFLASCASAVVLWFGISNWGWSPALIAYVAWGGSLAYLMVMTVIDKPWRGRKERLAARKREREASLHE